NLRGLSARGEAEEAPVESVLRLEGVIHNARRLPLPARLHRRAACRRVAVMPRGLDEDAPRVAVAGLGDAAAPLLAAAGALAGDQTQVGHQLAGVLEALEVADLGDQGHRRQRVD